jgi:hypothetical protein
MKSAKRLIPPILVKAIMHQLFRSLAYIHSRYPFYEFYISTKKFSESWTKYDPKFMDKI